MRTDDELLAYVRREAGVRRRRRQAVVSAAAIVAVVGIGAIAAASAGGEDPDRLRSTDDPTTTTATTEPVTTTSDPEPVTSTTAATTTTTSTTSSATTTTAATTTTTLPPIEPQVFVAEVEGMTVTLTATQDRATPDVVDLAIRVQAAHGSFPGGYVRWKPEEMEEFWGAALYEPMDCLDELEGIPLEPDPSAGPVDETFRLRHDYDATGRVVLELSAYVSFCSTDTVATRTTWEVQVGG